MITKIANGVETCINGHERCPENTSSSAGREFCRLCRAAASRRYQQKNSRPRPTADQRFWRQVLETGSCWEWTGTRGDYGHGRMYVAGRVYQAHRWAYEQLIGPVPDGLVLDHLCQNPPCVNPWHLDPVPNAVNTMRGTGITAENARKTHCKHGHEFTPANTLAISLRSGNAGRQCRACLAAANRRQTKAGLIRIDGRPVALPSREQEAS